MKARVLVLSDSLGLPRSEPQLVEYEDTYLFKLKESFPELEFIPLLMGGADLPTLYHNATFYYKSMKPQIVIVQSGIVDCAPRAFNRVENKIIKSIKLVNWFYNSPLKKWIKKIAKSRGITNTSSKEFSSCALKLKRAFPEAIILWNAIMPASEEYEIQLPGVTKNIKTYNGLLADIYGENFIAYDEFPLDGLMSDYHHLNRKGHNVFYDTLKNRLDSIVLNIVS